MSPLPRQINTGAQGLSPVREWRIHIGAHKTATTHIQYVLDDLRDTLHAGGLDLMVPEKGLRSLHLDSLARRRRPFPFLAKAADLTGRVASLRTGPDRVLLSEENLLGLIAPVIAGQFYRDQKFNLRVLGRLAQHSEVTLFLSIRSPDKFLASAYVQDLRQYAQSTAGFDVIRSWAKATPPRWSPLIRDIRRAAPNAKLCIWRYEDFRTNEREIMSRLCGMPIDPPASVAGTDKTRSGSAAAIAEIERLDRETSAEDRRTRVARVLADPAFSGSAFQPFSPQETQDFQKLYAQDQAEIDEISPGSLWRFS